MAKWYYNTKSKQVERGRISNWFNRMGPYETPELAAKALEQAANRNEQWDEEDRA